jgi:hypothetical protein
LGRGWWWDVGENDGGGKEPESRKVGRSRREITQRSQSRTKVKKQKG